MTGLLIGTSTGKRYLENWYFLLENIPDSKEPIVKAIRGKNNGTLITIPIRKVLSISTCCLSRS